MKFSNYTKTERVWKWWKYYKREQNEKQNKMKGSPNFPSDIAKSIIENKISTAKKRDKTWRIKIKE